MDLINDETSENFINNRIHNDNMYRKNLGKISDIDILKYKKLILFILDYFTTHKEFIDTEFKLDAATLTSIYILGVRDAEKLIEQELERRELENYLI